MRTRAGEAVYRAALFTLPPALAFLYIVSLLPVMTAEEWYLVVVLGMAVYLFAPVGTELVIPVVVIGLQAFHASNAVIVLGIASIVLVDVFTALFFLWNWDLVEQIPLLGRAIRRVEDKCRRVIARKKWAEGATLTALAAYVALPVQMTGGLFGSVLGRVMGLDKLKVFVAVTAGSLAGAVPMGAVAWLVGKPVLDALQSASARTIGAVAGILITAAFVGAVVFLYWRGKRNVD